MTGRSVKDLLPILTSIKSYYEDEEIRENDAIAKEMGKMYADCRRKATESNINVGDTVFTKNQMAGGKLEPNFSPMQYTVISRKGNDVTIRSNEGVDYRRCITHLKKWQGDGESGEAATEETVELPEGEREQMEAKRSRRETKLPLRYQ